MEPPGRLQRVRIHLWRRGQAFVAIGTNGYFSLIVGHARGVLLRTGVYLNPIGVVNAASYQPITASLAPGELITLFGTGLSSVTMAMQGGQAFPPQLGGVSVTINSIPCPIYYVSPTQMSVIVPYEVASNQTGLANIQVTNNGVSVECGADVTSAIRRRDRFRSVQDGIGFAAALHAATYQEISTGNPVQPGEYISLYLTGLGTVTPTITDGALGPSTTLSSADLFGAGFLGVFFNDYGPEGSTGNPGNIQFAGLGAGTCRLVPDQRCRFPPAVSPRGTTSISSLSPDAAQVNQIQGSLTGSSSGSQGGSAALRVSGESFQRESRAHRGDAGHNGEPSGGPPSETRWSGNG